MAEQAGATSPGRNCSPARTEARPTQTQIHRHPARSSTSPRCSPARRATDAIRQAVSDLKLAAGLRRARAADRAGADRRRGVRHRAGRRGGQRHRHRHHRARSSCGSRCNPAASSSPCSSICVVGLAITAALGLLMVGAAQPDLDRLRGAVRRPRRRFRHPVQRALSRRALRAWTISSSALRSMRREYAGAPLTLAAAATAAGFLSFLPTAYRGVSELGQIAGVGMLIAYITSITLLPALLTVLNPPGEPEPLGYRVLAPVDRFLERHRIAIIVGVALVVARRAAAALLPARSISIRSTCAARRSSRSRPSSTCGAIRSPAPTRSTCWRRTRATAAKVADRLRKTAGGRAGHARSTTSFPTIRTRSSPSIRGLRATSSQPPFKPEDAAAPPTDAENVAALNERRPTRSTKPPTSTRAVRAPTRRSAWRRL